MVNICMIYISYIESDVYNKKKIQMFVVNMTFISSREVKKMYTLFVPYCSIYTLSSWTDRPAQKTATITKTCLFKYTEKFNTKNENFQIKYSDIFQVYAQNIICGYSLEPLRRGGSNEYLQSMFWA